MYVDLDPSEADKSSVGLKKNVAQLLSAPSAPADVISNGVRIVVFSGESMADVHKVHADGWLPVREVRLAVMREEPDAHGSYAQEEALSEAEWRLRITDGAWFIAYLDADPVGVAAGVRSRNTRDCELVVMWVRIEQRGMGVAAQLAEAVHVWAEENGSNVVRFATADGNDRL